MTRASILEQCRHPLPHLGAGRRRYHQQRGDEQFIAPTSAGIVLGRGRNEESSKMKRGCRDAIDRVQAHLEPARGRDQSRPYMLIPDSFAHVYHCTPTSTGPVKPPSLDDGMLAAR